VLNPYKYLSILRIKVVSYKFYLIYKLEILMNTRRGVKMSRSAEDLIAGLIVFFLVFIVGGLILSLVFGSVTTGFFLALIAGVLLGGGGFGMLHLKGGGLW
jgi:hypothetical protein